MKRSSALAVFALLVLAALPAAAADPVIHAGIDPWVTVPEETGVDFRHNPLPKGFFCASTKIPVIWMLREWALERYRPGRLQHIGPSRQRA